MKIMLDEGAIMPTRAHKNDAGLDLYARETQVVPARESATFDTGVHIELPIATIKSTSLFAGEHLGNAEFKFKTVGFLKSKSGLNVNHGITSDGTIDMDYTGSTRM